MDVPSLVEAVIQPVHLPAGTAGLAALDFDVRCFLVRDRAGVVLVDTGLAGSAAEIESALKRFGADWTDVTDIILTHSHPDHTGGLDEVTSRALRAAVWAGAPDLPHIPSAVTIRPLHEGDHVRSLRVISTPGHTKGHICLLWEPEGLLFVGDAVGTMGGIMTRPPAPFTADPAEAEVSLGKLNGLAPTRMLFSHGAEVLDSAGQLQRLVEGSTTGK